jgi:hypothetical protein
LANERGLRSTAAFGDFYPAIRAATYSKAFCDNASSTVVLLWKAGVHSKGTTDERDVRFQGALLSTRIPKASKLRGDCDGAVQIIPKWDDAWHMDNHL